jgi:hypothetical protein
LVDRNVRGVENRFDSELPRRFLSKESGPKEEEEKQEKFFGPRGVFLVIISYDCLPTAVRRNESVEKVFIWERGLGLAAKVRAARQILRAKAMAVPVLSCVVTSGVLAGPWWLAAGGQGFLNGGLRKTQVITTFRFLLCGRWKDKK